MNATVLQVTCTINAAILASFFLFACLKRCFRLSLSNKNQKTNGNQQKTRLEASKPPTVFTTALRYSRSVVQNRSFHPAGSKLG